MDYDSDSSYEGDQAYQETSTLLGYPSVEQTGDPISHLGGVPAWIDEKTTPSGALAKCRVCNDFMSLLLQLNAELPQQFPGHERRLCVFSCRRKTCRRKEGSLRTLRCNRITKIKTAEAKKEPEVQQENKPSIDIGASLFGVAPSSNISSQNPFSTNNQKQPSNPFANLSSLGAKPAQRTETLPESFASKLKVSESSTSSQPPRPHEPWPTQDQFPSEYSTFYLDAEYETLSAPPTPDVKPSVPAIDAGEGSAGGKGEDKELFESAMDKTFQKFADRMAQNPEQVIRYEYDGTPVLYSSTDSVGKVLAATQDKSGKHINVATASGSKIPRCTNCGAHRVFEVQLTPHAITVLEEDEMSLDGMDWGTIIVAVCSQDCSPQGTTEGQVGYTEEWTGVQWEELSGSR